MPDVPHLHTDEDLQEYDTLLQSNAQSMDIQQRFNHLLHRRGIVPFPPMTNEPVNEYSTPGLLTMAFPALFPRGSAEYFRDHWPVARLTFSQYSSHLLTHKEDRFRRHLVCKFFVYNFLRRNTSVLSVNLAVKKHYLDGVTSSNVREQLQRLAFQRKLNMITSSLPGTSSYWYSQRCNLESMLQDIGNFFCFYKCYTILNHS